jgi:hypothetical protein
VATLQFGRKNKLDRAKLELMRIKKIHHKEHKARKEKRCNWLNL